MFDQLFFFIGLGFIFTHEMDAIKAHEWRIFPLTAGLNDRWGYLVFTIFHVPLYAFLLWALFGTGPPIAPAWRWGLDIFFIIHVGLHLLFLRHPKNEFTSMLSWVLIVGAGLAGLLDLWLS